jgi:hypothetical protein
VVGAAQTIAARIAATTLPARKRPLAVNPGIVHSPIARTIQLDIGSVAFDGTKG